MNPSACSPADLRRSPRLEFFLVPTEQEQLPVWVFKPQALAAARAGLVLNLSEGGLQILTALEPGLAGTHYELKLLLGEDEGVALFDGPVRLVWRDALGARGQLCGFEFELPNSLAEQFLQTQARQIAARQWVRCVLAERVTSPA